jgi:hypothetical protein
MATNANEVLTPSHGLVFVSTGSTATLPTIPLAGLPANYDASYAPSGWKSIGHTSLDDGITVQRTGDDPEVKGTWQVPNLKTTSPTTVYSLTINLESWTFDSLGLYYGGGSMVDASHVVTAVLADARGWLIPDVPTPTAKSLMVVARDGGWQVVEYHQNVTILGSDDIEFDPAEFTNMPVTATVLSGLNIVTPRLQDP